MKKEISALDLHFLVRELAELKGGIIKKIFQKGKIVHIEIYVPGKGTKILYYEPNIIFLTKSKRETGNQNFSQYLRKHLAGQRIQEIRQKDFDRILEIETNSNILIFEIFSKGNAIFCDKNYSILKVIERQKWKDREIRENIKYCYPPSVINPFSLSKNELKEKIAKSEKEIVAFLASDLSLSGKYAEEICKKANIKKQCKDVSDKEIENIYKTLHSLEFKPNIIFKNNEKVSFAPFELEGSKKYFETFSEVLDVFFSPKEEKTPEEKKYEKTIRNYEQKLKELKAKEAESKKKAELIYNNFDVLDKIIREINNMRQSKTDWSEIKEKIMKNRQVEKLDDKKGVFYFSGVEIDFRKSVQENASRYFEAAKKAKRKVASAEKIIIELKQTAKEKQRAKERWYEKFHWTVYKDFLIIGGRDASQNELIFRKYIESNDIVLHALLPGAPLVAIKSKGREIPEEVVREASVMAGVYSSAWKKGFAEADVYWIKPEQISKTAEAGEYLPKGSFMIRGKKNFIRVKMELAVGRNGKVVAGSREAVSGQAKKYVVLVPGTQPKEAVVKRVSEMLGISKTELQKIVPAGESEIL